MINMIDATHRNKSSSWFSIIFLRVKKVLRPSSRIAGVASCGVSKEDFTHFSVVPLSFQLVEISVEKKEKEIKVLH